MTSYATDYRILMSASHRTPASDPLVLKLRAFGRLTDGWSYGRGRQISSDVIAKAESLLLFGQQLHLKPEVFPGTDGDVIIAFNQGEDCVQATVNADLTLGLRVERGHGFDYEDVIEPVNKTKESDVFLRIAKLVPDGNKWKPLESSTSFTLAEYADASSIPPSKTQVP